MPDLKQPSDQEHPPPEKTKRRRFDDALRESIDQQIWKSIEPFFEDDQGLYIFGGVGTGKTHLCHAIKREWKRGRVALFPIDELLAKVRTVFNKDYDGAPEEAILNELSGLKNDWATPVEVLIVDDLGIEKPTEWAMQTLYTIVDRRYRECKKTIFTSNYSLDGLAERIGDRIPSRIAEMCRIVWLNGGDRRVLKIAGPKDGQQN